MKNSDLDRNGAQAARDYLAQHLNTPDFAEVLAREAAIPYPQWVRGSPRAMPNRKGEVRFDHPQGIHMRTEDLHAIATGTLRFSDFWTDCGCMSRYFG